MNKFEQLGLSRSIAEVLEKMGFENPTPVQEQAIPHLLTGDSTDFIGLAQTGTGKTAAFGLPLMELIDLKQEYTQALIMAPTRELGQQTAKQLSQFAAGKSRLNVEVVYGGAPIVNQIKALKRPTQIVVATPGRLLDLIKRKAVKLDHIKYVILDEADEMLNMGFQEAIDEILSYTPDERVTWLFSATMPPEIKKIVKKYMSNPVEVSINTKQKSNKDISHKYVVTKVSNKFPAIRRFLDRDPDMKGIMFCRTKRETQEIADRLSQKGYAVEALHGDLSQSQRDAVMKRFKARSMQLLIATDVAARGIDVNDLTYVIHHTLPDQLESYTHRSGRTGRAGNKGVSLAFINPRESRKIKDLERKLNVTFERVDVPSIEEMQSTRFSNWADQLLSVQVSEANEAIYDQIKEKFEDLQKEDLLKKLIELQANQLIVDSGEDANLNESREAGSESSSDYKRYFINLGSVDGFIKSDMVHLLSDLSGIDTKHFGTIKLLKNRSYFDLDKKYQNDFSKRFEGVEFEGRAVRVHPDGGSPKHFDNQSSSRRKGRSGKSHERKDRRKSGRRKRR